MDKVIATLCKLEKANCQINEKVRRVVVLEHSELLHRASELNELGQKEDDEQPRRSPCTQILDGSFTSQKIPVVSNIVAYCALNSRLGARP